MDRYAALQHAIKAHGPETDWCGNLYVYHPMAVADRVAAHWHETPPALLDGIPGVNVESGVIVALLHDVLEDTDYFLAPTDFSDPEWDALQRVTRFPGETYREYIEKAAGSPLSIIVKLADLSHNMSDERKENLDESQLARAQGLETSRHIPSRDRLWEALGIEWWPE